MELLDRNGFCFYFRSPLNRINIMDASGLKAELSIRMIELEKTIDSGMPYPELKKTYNQIKQLQYQIALTSQEVNNRIGEEDLIIE